MRALGFHVTQHKIVTYFYAGLIAGLVGLAGGIVVNSTDG